MDWIGSYRTHITIPGDPHKSRKSHKGQYVDKASSSFGYSILTLLARLRG